MALGTNLKKQKLIPDVVENKPAKKSITKKKTEVAKKTAPAKKSTKPKAVRNKTDNYISESALRTKQELRQKFNLEIDHFQSKRLQLVVFNILNQLYAIEMNLIKEVIATPKISKVPNTPKHMLGVANIRTAAIPIFDLAMRYGLGEDLSKKINSYTMIIASKFGSIGFTTNEVPNTMTINGIELEKVTDLMSDSILNENFIKAIINQKDRYIMLLDINEMIEDEKLKVIKE